MKRKIVELFYNNNKKGWKEMGMIKKGWEYIKGIEMMKMIERLKWAEKGWKGINDGS